MQNPYLAPTMLGVQMHRQHRRSLSPLQINSHGSGEGPPIDYHPPYVGRLRASLPSTNFHVVSGRVLVRRKRCLQPGIARLAKALQQLFSNIKLSVFRVQSHVVGMALVVGLKTEQEISQNPGPRPF